MSQTSELADAFQELRTRIERQMDDAVPERKPGLARALARVKRQEKEARRHALCGGAKRKSAPVA